MSGGAEQTPVGLTRKLRDNIDALTERRRSEIENAPWTERLSDRITAFAGSMLFVFIHLVLFGGWIAINIGWLPILPKFDESLVVLAMAASVEAIFLSTFVLISQNRMMSAADRRADLDLHVNLLAEHELTRLASVIERIALKLEVPIADKELEEVKQDIEPTRVMEVLERIEDDEEASS